MSQKKNKIVATFELEREYWEKGIRLVAGLDEAGRGPLSGPVIAGAVVFHPDAEESHFPWAMDSKAMSHSKIYELAARIRAGEFMGQGLIAWGIGGASVREIDKLNIRKASVLAMNRARKNLEKRFGGGIGGAVEWALIDGNPAPEYEGEAQNVIKGDARSISIAVSSMLAKDCRDTLMKKLARRYPQFSCWESDKGYASPAHREALELYGPVSGHHRASFKPVAQLSIF